MPRRLLPILLVLLATPAVAEGAHDGELGDLNPDEMSLSHSLDQALRGKTSMTTCASGYLMTKSGQHDMARQVFSRCAEAGYTGAMTWMSYLEENGFGARITVKYGERWTYNFGKQRFMQMVTVVNGTVTEIENGPVGE